MESDSKLSDIISANTKRKRLRKIGKIVVVIENGYGKIENKRKICQYSQIARINIRVGQNVIVYKKYFFI